jgi:hypothetical protein
MNLDVFNNDAFKLVPLSQAITLMPFQPTMIRSMGIFNEQGISTIAASIEMENNVLTLVSTAPRGSPGAVKNLQRRTMKDFRSVHLPQRVQVYADEVLGLRAFGTSTEVEVAMSRLQKKMAVARRDLDLTIEFQRVNAIKGIVYDADNATVLWNWFTEFGVSQQTMNFDLATGSTDVRQKCVDTSRKVEDELGGIMNSGVEVLCSPEFFDALVGHATVIDSYKYQQGQTNRSDLRKSGFEYGGLLFKEYRGQVGAVKFIETGCAYAVPTGVPDLFTTFYSPADHMDAIGTEGLPYYASLEPMDHGKGIDCLTQSNPLHLVNRPRAIIKLGRNASFN